MKGEIFVQEIKITFNFTLKSKLNIRAKYYPNVCCSILPTSIYKRG